MNIYVDLSGSMFEMGGKSALEYILKSFKDYSDFKEIECDFFDFEGKKVDIFNLNPKKSDIKNLKLKEGFNVLISDGYLKRVKLDIYAIAFSGAANIRNLNFIAKEVFDESNIIKVVEKYISLNKEIKEDNDEW